ncbi:BON domain-containing protein [Nitrosomonas aestuarii]|uniref:Hyperosmotically inducible protein n=1 Tax=Nitrosomonas aestuarii TaxID=52441 RepID=A0A1I3Y6F2_9PROT|nr:BON domain-containing protein [Nitrosomonas aestuarii]PTN11916.1 hyperosmotically inducible protein [Nitrosomonas aestuarii]SFK27395.1 hyperosmotically inducible protein [Nitrosomonas aestuarii]
MFNLCKLTTPAILFMSVFVLTGCENYAERTHESWIEAPKGIDYDDSTIYARIAYAVNTDPDLQGSDVEIKVDDGKVLLTGTVTNNHHITRINMLSWMVDGVKDVDNQVIVR